MVSTFRGGSFWSSCCNSSWLMLVSRLEIGLSPSKSRSLLKDPPCIPAMVKAATGDSVATVAPGVVKAWVIRNGQLFSAFSAGFKICWFTAHTHTHVYCKNVVHKATHWNYLELGQLMKAEDLLKPDIA